MFKRMADIESLPEKDKQCLLLTVDNFIKATKLNSFKINKPSLTAGFVGYICYLMLYFFLKSTPSSIYSIFGFSLINSFFAISEMESIKLLPNFLSISLRISFS